MGLLLAGWVGTMSPGALAEEGRSGRDGESRKERPEAGARPERPEAQNVDAMERRLEELKRRIRGLAEEGKREEAEAVEREAREVARNLERVRSERRDHEAAAAGPARIPDRDRAEVERRQRHMRMAAENLAAAGMEDMARRIMQEAEGMDRRLREAGGGREAPRPQIPPEAMQRHLEELSGAVQELRRQVEQLRHEMRERGK
jgi:TolA-binding protein